MTWAISYPGSCGWMVLCLLSASGVFPSESNRITIRVFGIQCEIWSWLSRRRKEGGRKGRTEETAKGKTQNKTNQSKSSARGIRTEQGEEFDRRSSYGVSVKYHCGDCCFLPCVTFLFWPHKLAKSLRRRASLWQSDEENSKLESYHSLTFPSVPQMGPTCAKAACQCFLLLDRPLILNK